MTPNSEHTVVPLAIDNGTCVHKCERDGYLTLYAYPTCKHKGDEYLVVHIGSRDTSIRIDLAHLTLNPGEQLRYQHANIHAGPSCWQITLSLI